uniref:Nucleotide exchange factor Fes1 domain-containing protein n=1 Tax=Chlamydomonas leiostraca TaxID=1034604 RepID=A0A7S0WF29_9CHLO|mmetsp:Transcript_122/g.261  ORF Transcript_122/g.261 Transcript_122/m.261 type:complete len:389 (+) Transcript_122:222-1388(+)|eukprot:CAMPEP_0202863408 /NCGR_PEP_ID=MMETSP1391-20130828/4061_1 /ASSEMBLY_ACC=CAM_ASM_000867 /TAXON_ID=1034604 /ORGANISM="Chlamydomonas leiostraca, Strain SAG 11-49" /LENGTH=388 /DNA_ID=CAMNT_0049543043 /DNA_START=197 /DNA_END=1363 /DNA_ORIENTATION=-
MGTLPQWKGLFDWSIKYQDGTKPSNWDPSEYDPEKMKWLEGVLKHYMQDFGARMKEIKASLDTGVRAEQPPAAGAAASESAPPPPPAQRLSLEDKELLLEELLDIVSSIDFARDLHKVGGLPTLLDLLDCDQPSLRWRAAEVVATCMANNPPVQQWFMQGGVLPRLLRLLDEEGAGEPGASLRTKGLLAVSALVRHNRPGLEAVRLAGGLPRLVRLAADPDRRVSRKALSLTQYVVTQHWPDAKAVVDMGLLPPVLVLLGDASEEAGDARTAALELLRELARSPDVWGVLKESNELRSALHVLEAAHSRLAGDDAEAAQEEVEARAALSQALSSAQPPAMPASESDHLDVGYDQGHAEPVTLPVHQQGPAAQQGAAPQQAPVGLLGPP